MNVNLFQSKACQQNRKQDHSAEYEEDRVAKYLLEPKVVNKAWGWHREPNILPCRIAGVVVAGMPLFLLGVHSYILHHVSQATRHVPVSFFVKDVERNRVLVVQSHLVEDPQSCATGIRGEQSFAVPHPASCITLRLEWLEGHLYLRHGHGMDLALLAVPLTYRAGTNLCYLVVYNRAIAHQDMCAEANSFEKAEAENDRSY